MGLVKIHKKEISQVLLHNEKYISVPPLDVEIFQAEPGPLSADKSFTFHCHSHGARPGATLSWFDSHGNRLIAASHQVILRIQYSQYPQTLDKALKIF